MNLEDKLKHIKSLLRNYRYRLTILNKYRNRDLDKEILDTLNEINKLKKKLEELNEKIKTM